MPTIRAAITLVALAATSAVRSPVASQASTVIFVRHAEKGTTPTAADPDLSDLGRARAGDLVSALAHYRLDAVLVTEYRRTRQTGDSVASAQHLAPVVIATRGDAKAYAQAVVAELRKLPAGSAALVVGHSNTFAPVIEALGGPRVPDFCDSEYASMYLLQLSAEKGAPRMLKTSFGAPDTPEGIACSRQMRLR